MQKVLITGGAGFIGSNLSNYLIGKNYDVIVLDNLSTGKKINLNKKVKFIKGDIRDKEIVRKAGKKVKFIFHLAAKSALQETIKKPKECFETNINGTINVLDVAIQNNSKVIFSSTCAVYPLNNRSLLNEKKIENLETPYAIAKKTAEDLIRFYTIKKGLKATIVRFFNVYGPKQSIRNSYSAVIPLFINLAKKNKNLVLNNGGKQSRDFIHVDDICLGLYKAAKFPKFDIFNLGTGKATKIKEVARVIIKILNKGKIKVKKGISFDANFSCANTQKAKKILKFKSQISLEKGILDLINEKKN